MKDLRNRPVGIFDSGFGGLTVARAIVDLLPEEDILYLGDTQRAPYGPRSLAEVREYTLQCLDWLVVQGVKCLVIACNTGSSAALRDARERYPQLPIIEVVIPAATKAASITRSGEIGVICTQATANSRSYDDALEASAVTVTTQPCPAFVPFVEAGVTTGRSVMDTAASYLQPLKDQGVDTLILGCTHYPLLSGVISFIMGDEVALVSSADECARSAYAVLNRSDLLCDPKEEIKRGFFTTGDPAQFEGLGHRLMGGFVRNAERISLGN